MLKNTDILEYNTQTDSWQVNTQLITGYINFFSMEIAGKKAQKPDFEWEEIQGYDEKASKQAASETVERLNNEI